jgi:hypothetical protein
MPLAPLGLIDLSFVTDHLTTMLTQCIDDSPMWGPGNEQITINVSGNAPDALRSSGDTELSLYLFHVSQDPFQRNRPANGLRQPLIPFQPLSLNLYYLLSAFSKDDYVHEQQAMSIALRCFHEHPIVRTNVVIDGVVVPEEFTLTMNVETADEISRLWQATTAAMRLSTVYKVSVVFMTPEAPARPIAPNPERLVIGADATALPFAKTGQVTGTRRTVAYNFPADSDADPPVTISKAASYDLSPASAAPGQRATLAGAGLNQPTSDNVWLLAPDGSETNVTAWKAPDPIPPSSILQTESQIVLDLPATSGAAPANTPAPGVYQLRAGNGLAANADGAQRTNATPFAIAARIPAADPPLLAEFAGVYTFNGAGFVPGSTEVLLETVALTAAGGAPAAGEFHVPNATTIAFRPPATLPAGRYGVRVRVNNVESDPSWWIELP